MAIPELKRHWHSFVFLHLRKAYEVNYLYENLLLNYLFALIWGLTSVVIIL